MPCQYSFTITIQPKHYKRKPLRQYINACDNFYELFYNNIWFDIEDCVAEITKAGNIHLHGICEYKPDPKQLTYPAIATWRDFFRDHPYFGFVDIKPLHDYHGWVEYMNKSASDPLLIWIQNHTQWRPYKREAPSKEVKGPQEVDVMPVALSALDDGLKIEDDPTRPIKSKPIKYKYFITP